MSNDQKLAQQIALHTASIAYHALEWGFAQITPQQAMDGLQDLIQIAIEETPGEDLEPIFGAVSNGDDPYTVIEMLRSSGYLMRHEAMSILFAGVAGILRFESDQYLSKIGPLLLQFFTSNPMPVYEGRLKNIEIKKRNSLASSD